MKFDHVVIFLVTKQTVLVIRGKKKSEIFKAPQTALTAFTGNNSAALETGILLAFTYYPNIGKVF